MADDDGRRWCKKCKEVFQLPACSQSHANFVYSKHIPPAAAAAPAAAAPAPSKPPAAAAPRPAPDLCGRYTCLKRSQLRAGAAMDSTKAGVLPASAAVVEVVEVVELQPAGPTRCRLAAPAGWVSLLSSAGDRILQPGPEERTKPASRPSIGLCQRAVGLAAIVADEPAFDGEDGGILDEECPHCGVWGECGEVCRVNAASGTAALARESIDRCREARAIDAPEASAEDEGVEAVRVHTRFGEDGEVARVTASLAGARPAAAAVPEAPPVGWTPVKCQSEVSTPSGWDLQDAHDRIARTASEEDLPDELAFDDDVWQEPEDSLRETVSQGDRTVRQSVMFCRGERGLTVFRRGGGSLMPLAEIEGEGDAHPLSPQTSLSPREEELEEDDDFVTPRDEDEFVTPRADEEDAMEIVSGGEAAEQRHGEKGAAPIASEEQEQKEEQIEPVRVENRQGEEKQQQQQQMQEDEEDEEQMEQQKQEERLSADETRPAAKSERDVEELAGEADEVSFMADTEEETSMYIDSDDDVDGGDGSYEMTTDFTEIANTTRRCVPRCNVCLQLMMLCRRLVLMVLFFS